MSIPYLLTISILVHPSAYILNLCSSLESQTRNDAPEFFHPRTYISGSSENDFPSTEEEAVVEFFWKPDTHPQYYPRVPALRDGSFDGRLVGYVCFIFFAHDEEGGAGNSAKPSYKIKNRRRIGISWVMSNYHPASSESTTVQKYLRSEHYTGSLTDFSIPTHCVEFFTWLLRDVRQNWEEIFSQSESYLDERVCQPQLLNPLPPPPKNSIL